MEKIKQYLLAGGGSALALPETLVRAFNCLFTGQALTSSGWNVGSGLLVPRTGTPVTFVQVNGAVVRLSTNVSAPSLPASFVLTTGQYGAILTTCDSGGTLRNYFSTVVTAASVTNGGTAGLVFPIIPAAEAVIGIVYLAPTTTFTGGTTALDAANVNAVFSSVVGPFYPNAVI